MNTSTGLLTIEEEAGCEVLEFEENRPSNDMAQAEEILIISGTITISP